MTIIFKNLKKTFNGKVIFENISGKINNGDKIGIVGINGVGKTTLINILTSIEEYDDGVVEYMPNNIRTGYLNQDNRFDEDITVVQKLEDIKRQFGEEQIGSNDNYEKNLKELLLNMEFKERDLNKKVCSLSGGEKTKLALSLVLIKNPDILILDEPTNHLDLNTIKWLEKFINSINKTIIIVSHDREFLDNTVKSIFEMHKDKLEEYKGNYTDYKIQKNLKIKNTNKEYNKQQREIKHFNKMIEEKRRWFEKAHNSAGTNDYLRRKAKKHMNTVWSSEKKLQRLLDNKIEKPKDDVSAAFHLINKGFVNDKLPNYLIKINRLEKKFGNKVIFDNVAFNLRKGDKAALIGPNGSGKTTLLKMILGYKKEDSGTITVNPSVRIGYFSQELENLKLKNTIIEEITSKGISQNDARLMLASLLFRREDVFKNIGKLSMGEKCRVAFTKLLLSQANILILDEPTNYMDIVSKESIENVLRQYKGTILFVSHDLYFIKHFTNKILEIDKHKINVYDGNYEYYLDKKEQKRKKEEIGLDYDNIRDKILYLQCEIAFLSGKLNDLNINEDEKKELEEKYFIVARKLKEYKAKLGQ